MAKEDDKKEEQKFEEVIAELETIVNQLDSSIGLEESLKKFERGMALAKIAEERLKTIENQFEKIQSQFSAQADVVEQTANAADFVVDAEESLVL